jgi:hypothetical protein
VKSTLALILFLGGTTLMLFGFIMAVLQLAGLYSATLTDAMADGPDAKDVSSHMIRYVIIGAIGIIPAAAGSMMLGKGLIGRIVKRMQKNQTPPPPGQKP